MNDSSFQRFGGVAAIALAACSVLYALLLFLGTDAAETASRLARVVETRGLNQQANLLLGVMGLLSTVGVMAVFERVRVTGGAWARWAAALGVVGAAMTAAHGLWDFMRTPVLLAQWEGGVPGRRDAISAFAGVPNAVDPRGLGAFLFLGLFVLVAARLLWRGTATRAWLAPLGLAYGFLLVVLFLAGLIGPPEVRAILAAITVGIVGPLWWIGVGWTLVSEASPPQTPTGG